MKLSHVFKQQLLSSSLVLMVLPQAFGNMCVNHLNAHSPHFEFIDYRLEMRQQSRIRIGGGAFAEVYLHFDKYKNKWVVLKKYHPYQVGNRVIDPLLFLESDMNAAQLIAQLGDFHPFKVITYYKNADDPHVAELDYQIGMTLEQVLVNQRLSQNIKESLIFSYERGIENLKNEMEKKNFDEIKVVKQANRYNESISLNTLQAQGKTSTGKVAIWIKPDNILVDPYTLQLIIIDPH